MATKTVVSVVDDIDGSESAETVTFTYEGVTYEIDLARKNRDALDAALSPYIEAARSTGRGSARRAKVERRGRCRSNSCLGRGERNRGIPPRSYPS